MDAILKFQDGSDGVSDNAESNIESYWEPERFQHEFLRERFTNAIMRTKVLADGDTTVPDFESDVKPILLGQRETVFIVNAFSSHLVPAVGTDNTWNVGPLADNYVDPDWKPEADLVEFLKSRPVCVGFGSMPFGKVTAVLEALYELDRKAVVVGQCFVDALATIQQQGQDVSVVTVMKEWLDQAIYSVSSVPYPWLLPQCSMMLSHGGAGVVNAVLRAGIPNVIAPLFGDQFFWAKLLTVKQLGVVAGKTLTTITKDTVMEGIRQADDPVVRETARQLGEIIRAESKTGVELLVERLLEISTL